MITSSSILDAILDAALSLPTGIEIDSVESPVSNSGEHRVVLLDTSSRARQTVRIDPLASPSTVGRLLLDAAAQLIGKKPTRKPRSKRKNAIA